MTNINEIQSSDEFPVGMTFTREPIDNPLQAKHIDDCIVCGNRLQFVRNYPATCGMCKTWEGTRNDNHGRITEFNEDNHTTRHD